MAVDSRTAKLTSNRADFKTTLGLDASGTLRRVRQEDMPYLSSDGGKVLGPVELLDDVAAMKSLTVPKPTLPDHAARRRDVDSIDTFSRSSAAFPERYGARGDGTGNDTPAFVEALTQTGMAVLMPGSIYAVDNLSIPARTSLIGCKQARLRRAVGAKSALTVSTAFTVLRDVLIDLDVYDANGMVDPNKAGFSYIVAASGSTITVQPGHGPRFAAGMHAFFEVATAKGFCEAERILSVAGDTLTLIDAPRAAAVIGRPIIADFPAVDFQRGAFGNVLDNVTIRNVIVGIQTGSTTGLSAGNASIVVDKVFIERVAGAGIVQTESMAGEMMHGLTIDGAHTVRTPAVATAGQTTFPYLFNNSPYMHRGGSEPSITATKNGSSVGVTVDAVAGTVTLPTPSAAGDQIIVSHTEWAPRGILCRGAAGSVSGMGRIGFGVGRDLSVGLEVRGGPNGIQFLSLDLTTFDTMSYAGAMFTDVNSVVATGCRFLFAPYPLLLGSGSTNCTFWTMATTVMDANAINDLTARPSRADIWAQPGCSNIMVDRSSWRANGYTVNDESGGAIRWGADRIIGQNGSQLNPYLSMRSDPGTGFYSPSAGLWNFTSNDTNRLQLSAQGIGVPYGTVTSPGMYFLGATNTGWHFENGQMRATLGADRFFIGQNDAGPISVPLRLAPKTLTEANALPGLTNGQLLYGTTGGPGGVATILTYVGGAWDYLVRGSSLGAALTAVGPVSLTGRTTTSLTATRSAVRDALGYANTTTTAPVRIGLTGANTEPLYTLADVSVIEFEIAVSAIGALGTAAAWRITGAAKRGAGAGTTALLGVPTVTPIGVDGDLSSASVQAVIDTTNGGVTVQVTGVGGTLYWTANLKATAQVRP